jgi:hypothetical protein
MASPSPRTAWDRANPQERKRVLRLPQSGDNLSGYQHPHRGRAHDRRRHPAEAMIGQLVVNAPITDFFETRIIMTIISGTAATPLMTALQECRRQMHRS